MASTKMVDERIAEMMPMMRTKREISISSGVRWPLSDAAMPAIWPIMHASPVCTTTPMPSPSVTRVPENATFAVSSISAEVVSMNRSCGSASPVSDALSTFMSLVHRRRMSAGTRSPARTRITSPRTSSAGGTWRSTPSRTTIVDELTSPAICAITFAAARLWKYSMVEVRKMTMRSTTPSQRLIEFLVLRR
eukprot:Amastigsp_a3487_17.p3 type:complete len:192 gc:universal Amastigsp_a3487_17:1233-1808(+)